MAVAKPSDSSFRLSASPDWLTFTPFGRLFIDRQVVDLLDGVAERGVADEVGGDGRLAVAVVAVDAGRTLVELDVGDRPKRHAALLAVLAIGTRNCSSILQVAARAVLELNADRHQPVAGVELGQRRTDVADGGDADGLRQAFGGDAEPRRQIGARLDAQLGPVERRFPRSRWRSVGIRFICVASSLATLLTMLLSAPVTTSEIARRPFSSRNQ